jgi:hypothetical protein
MPEPIRDPGGRAADCSKQCSGSSTAFCNGSGLVFRDAMATAENDGIVPMKLVQAWEGLIRLRRSNHAVSSMQADC